MQRDLCIGVFGAKRRRICGLRLVRPFRVVADENGVWALYVGVDGVVFVMCFRARISSTSILVGIRNSGLVTYKNEGFLVVIGMLCETVGCSPVCNADVRFMCCLYFCSAGTCAWLFLIHLPLTTKSPSFL